MDVRGPSSANQLHVSSSGADDGGYLESYGPSGAIFSTGIAFNGSQWIAKAPGWSMISAYGGGIYFLDGTGATVGSPVTILPVPMALVGGNVGIGTTNPPYPLSVKGAIGASEVIVTSTNGWSDYVFNPGYRLAPLGEVAAYIDQHHHLRISHLSPRSRKKASASGRCSRSSSPKSKNSRSI
jgi:hypothetical protein